MNLLTTPDESSRRATTAHWQKPVLIVFCTMVVAGIVLGGAPSSPGWQTMVLALVASALLPLAHAAGAGERFAKLPLMVRVLAIAILVLPLLQLIPLPPAFHQTMGEGALRPAVLATLGLADDWRPISVVPAATLFAFAMLVPPAAAFYASLALDRRGRRTVVFAFLSIILVAILVGLAQFGSKGTALDIYGTSHRGSFLGFFANRNHQGLMMAIAGAFAIYLAKDRIKRPSVAMATAILVSLVFLISSVGTASRAGIGLTLLGLTIAFYVRFVHGTMRWPVVVGGALTAAATLYFVTFSTTAQTALSRFSQIEENGRLEIWEKSAPLFEQYLGVGAGIGSYTAIYPAIERLEDVNPLFFNRMHNDYLELIVEAGLPGLLILLGGSICLAWAVLRGMRNGFEKGSFAVPAAIALGLVALHSIVDYPLRTQSHAILFGIACAFLLIPPKEELGTAGDSSTRSVRFGWFAILGQATILAAIALFSSYQAVKSNWSDEPGIALANSEVAPMSVAEISRAKRQLARTPLDQELLNLIYANEARAGIGVPQRREYVALLRQMGWRDTVTQQNLLYEAVTEDNLEAALDHMDALLRRERLTDQIMPLLAQLEAEPEGMPLIAARLARNPKWRESYLSSEELLTDPRVLSARLELLELLDGEGGGVTRLEYRAPLRQLFAQNQREAIATIARSMMPAEARAEFLFDGQFDRLKDVPIEERRDTLPHEWSTSNRSGLSTQIVSEDWSSRMLVRWNGRGAPLIASTLAFLPSGSQPRLQVSMADSSTLSAIDALRFSLFCPGEAELLFVRRSGDSSSGSGADGRTAYFEAERSLACDYPQFAIVARPQRGDRGASLSIDSIQLFAE